MRKRLIRSTLVLVLGTVIILAGLTAWQTMRSIDADARQQLDAEAEQIAATLLDDRQRYGSVSLDALQHAQPAGREIQLTTDDGALLSTGDVTTSDRSFVETVPGLGTIIISDTTSEVRNRQLAELAWIVTTATLLSVAAVFVAVRSARRLTRPLEALANSADLLGSDQQTTLDVRYGAPEVDRVAEALERAAARIDDLLTNERALTLEASHQLRTPLTALSIRLEEIQHTTQQDDVRREAAVALEQVERLSDVVTDLMVQRGDCSEDGPRTSLLAVSAQQADEWRPAFQAKGRELVAEFRGSSFESTERSVPAGPVGQILSVLLENALIHGGGQTSISISELHGGVMVKVEDGGAGVDDAVAGHIFERSVSGSGRTGLGLSAARASAISVGGRLELVRRRPAAFALFLPGGGDRREDPSPVGPESKSSTEANADDVRGDVVRKS